MQRQYGQLRETGYQQECSMGYVFDALNKADGDDDQSDPKSKPVSNKSDLTQAQMNEQIAREHHDVQTDARGNTVFQQQLNQLRQEQKAKQKVQKKTLTTPRQKNIEQTDRKPQKSKPTPNHQDSKPKPNQTKHITQPSQSPTQNNTSSKAKNNQPLQQSSQQPSPTHQNNNTPNNKPVTLSVSDTTPNISNTPNISTPTEITDEQVNITDINELPDSLDDRLVALIDPSSIMGEEYRAIRTRLLAKWQQRRHIIHTITSATPKEGKTLTSLNLGMCFGEIVDRRTIVVECDLRIPMFSKMFGLKDSPGLIQLINNEATLDESTLQSPCENLTLLPSGGVSADDATQLLGSTAMTNLLHQLRQQYDHVIIDTPPVLELADAGIVGRQSDEVILIVRMNRTPRHLIDQAITALNSYDAPVSGTILTDMKLATSGGYSYRYGYRYGYGKHRRYTYQRRRYLRKSA